MLDTLGDVIITTVLSRQLYFNREDEGRKGTGLVRYRKLPGDHHVFRESIIPSDERFERYDSAMTEAGLIANERTRAAIEAKK